MGQVLKSAMKAAGTIPEISNTTLFTFDDRVAEWCNRMTSDGDSLRENPPFPQPMPFDNLFLEFMDFGLHIYIVEIEHEHSLMFTLHGLGKHGEKDYKLPTKEWEAFVLSLEDDKMTCIGQCICDFENGKGRSSDNTEKVVIGLAMTVMYLFTKVLSCKNVKVADCEMPKGWLKSRKRKGKLPSYSKKVILIQSSISGPNGGHGDSWEQRHHLCRGHFKEYTEDAPLLGKYVGRYWWNPQARASKSKGRIDHEYKIGNH